MACLIQSLINYICSAQSYKKRQQDALKSAGVQIQRCDTQPDGLTFSDRQQKDSRGIRRGCMQHWICCSTVVSQPAPLSSCFYLSLSLSHLHTHTDTHWLSERSSLLPLSLSLTSAFSLFLPPLPPSPLLFFNREITRQREQPGCSPPVRTLITCGSWHSNRISYALLPLPSLSQAHQLTHRHAPQRQMGIPGLERLCLPHQERADQKLQPVFYEVRVIKLLADLVYLKTTGPCGPSSSRGVPPPRDTGGRGGGVRRCGGGLEGRKEGEGEKHIWDCNSEIPFTSTRKAKLHIRWIYWKRRHYEKRQIITEWRTYLPKITLCLKHRHTTQRGGEIWAQT